MLRWIIVPFAVALVAPWLQRLVRGHVALLLAVIPALGVLLVTSRLPLAPGVTITEATPWVPYFGIDLAFRLDGLSATFVLLICGIGTAVLLYAAAYMRDDARLGRLCGLLLFFLGAMLGLVLSDNLFVLFVFWELTSIASYLLIGFKHEKPEARDAARQALLVTGTGGLLLLAGFILLTIAALQSGMPLQEASRISALAGTGVAQHTLFLPALLLIVAGAFSKSAQMPLHFWLPNAMTAPTPVSAYLHSATMVKAGVYLLARLNPVFGDTPLWHLLLTVTGAVTMLVAAGMAAGQTDLKRILAYTTVSVLGTLTMLIGVGTELAIKAAVVYLVAHACYKATLFLVAGSIEHAAGTRDVRKLGGLARAMPLTAATGLLAALSMAGAPPMFGFIGKELLLKAKLDLEYLGIVLILVATVANILLIAMALVVTIWPFFGRRNEAVHSVREVPILMLVGPFLLAAAGLFIGLVPGTFDSALGSAMATAIGGRPIQMELKLWHGLSPAALTALAMSTITLALGAALFLRLRNWLAHIAGVVARLGPYGPTRAYALLYDGLMTAASRITRRTQTGSLRQYVRAILLVLLVICLYPLAKSFPLDTSMPTSWNWYELVLVGLMLAGALAAILSRSAMSGVVLLGITGLLIAVLFALFSAPDLAITQIMVEALTVILLVLIFYRWPASAARRPQHIRVFDATVALAAGACIGALLLATSSPNLPTTISDQLTRMSKPEAYGRNVVNVILVDFRALDTLGEITVVAMAALGAYALIKTYRKHRTGGCRP